jgi:hypothetical protein
VPQSVVAKDDALAAVIAQEDYAQLWSKYQLRYIVTEDSSHRLRNSPDPKTTVWNDGHVWIFDLSHYTPRPETLPATTDEKLNDTFQAEAEGKPQHAKLSSTQLPAYFVGIGQWWWDLGRKYQSAEGSTFTLEEFHHRAGKFFMTCTYSGMGKFGVGIRDGKYSTNKSTRRELRACWTLWPPAH